MYINSDGIIKFFKEELDEEQLKAVLESKGRTLIIAGPGSGKTRVITYKIAYLIHQGVSPENILLVTFTKAAAREMIDRVRNVTQMDLSRMTAGTFHHVCNLILRRYSSILNYDPNFTILDSEDSKDLMKLARSEYLSELLDKEEASRIPKAEVILSLIGLSVNTLKSIEETITEYNPYFYNMIHHIEAIYEKYMEMKIKMNAMDYDDLLMNTYHLLLTHSNIREKISQQYEWVLVDEFQDTSYIQYEIVNLLASYHNNLIVVGDDAQSIYSFRGARFENVWDFVNEGDVKKYWISTNYRSTPEIVDLINNIIPTTSIEKKLKSARKNTGIKPVIVETFDEIEQAEFVTELVRKKVEQEGYDYKDIAILYRIHAMSMLLQTKLDMNHIPYRVLSGLRFIETRHIKDMLAFLKILANPYDDLSWIRVLKLFPGVGDVTAKKTYNFIRNSLEEGIDILEALENSPLKHKVTAFELLKTVLSMRDETPDQVMEYVYQEFYKDYSRLTFKNAYTRNLDIERFIEISSRYKNIMSFLEDILLSEEVEIRDVQSSDKKDRVTLSTVHGAKGLEWKIVIVISVNPGDFPFARSITEGKIDEEERLFYVAVTRAKDELYLIKQITGMRYPYYGNRFVMRQKIPDFLSKIPKELVDIWKVKRSWR